MQILVSSACIRAISSPEYQLSLGIGKHTMTGHPKSIKKRARDVTTPSSLDFKPHATGIGMIPAVRLTYSKVGTLNGRHYRPVVFCRALHAADYNGPAKLRFTWLACNASCPPRIGRRKTVLLLFLQPKKSSEAPSRDPIRMGSVSLPLDFTVVCPLTCSCLRMFSFSTLLQEKNLEVKNCDNVSTVAPGDANTKHRERPT
ncbi:hypothetical protein JB92DRAFT_1433636 [Gautieria morchelliformis]|nr:hypothetical protein JB92DRAFT_1433636 [Gautieria morchelliformis]